MKRLLGIAFSLALITVALLLFCTGCGNQSVGTAGKLDPLPMPPITTEAINQGTLFVRCSEPEGNTFSIQFVGVCPTNYLDYVGFEACIVYADGTRGSRQIVKLRTLHRSIEDEEGNTVITPADFGEEYKDGYLFVRALDRIPVDDYTLSYEIASYYVVDNKKVYTAKQVYSLRALLEEHILIGNKPVEVGNESDLIEVQKWEKFENTHKHEDPKLSNTYYLGASIPDNHGNLQMYATFAVPDANATAVGLRYNFTQKSGENAGVSTSVSRAKALKLYKTIVTEKETLTLEDFGISEGYIAVVPFSEQINIISMEDFTFNLNIYYSRNAVETTLIDVKFDFKDVVAATVLSREGVGVTTYTYIPINYNQWTFFGKDQGNSIGDGVLRLRLTDATNYDGDYKFNMQIAAAVPTRFAQRVAFVYHLYDKNGNVIEPSNREIASDYIYRSIFVDDLDTVMTAKDFGLERGYIMSMNLNYIDYDSEIHSLKIEAYYKVDGIKHYVTSQTIEMETLRGMIDVIE